MKKIILRFTCISILIFCSTNLFAQTGDMDGDAVLDNDDLCPTTFGTKSNKGCPDETNAKATSNKSLGFVFSFDKNGNFAVDFVFEKSPAQLAGLQVGDILTGFNEATLFGKEKIEVLELIKSLPDKNVKIKYQRNGIKKEITLNKADRSSFTNVCLSGNCKNGKGIFQDSIGNKYDGEFKNGVRVGNGKMYYVSRNVYYGSWANNMKSGKGKYSFNSGDEYNGDFKSDLYEGKGEFKWANGDIYNGGWVSGKKSGNGKLILSNGNSYIGDFLESKMNGKGIYKFANGGTYTGEFKNNNYEGYGELKYADGDIYNGGWVNSEKSGYGKLTMINGNNYEGNFLNNKMNGKGTYKFASGHVYNGEFKNDQYEGYGELKYADGTLKKGMWLASVFQDDAIAKSNATTSNQISREQFNADAKKYNSSTADKVAAIKKNSEEIQKSKPFQEMTLDNLNAAQKKAKANLEFRKALEESKKQNELDYPKIAGLMAVPYLKENKFNEAIKVLDEAIKNYPKYAANYNFRGIAKKGLKDYENAILDFTEAIKLEPNNAEYYLNRAMTKSANKDELGAIPDYDLAILKGATAKNIYLNRGIAKSTALNKTAGCDDLKIAKDAQINGAERAYQICGCK
jgi:hypothetical protein